MIQFFIFPVASYYATRWRHISLVLRRIDTGIPAM